MRRSEGSVPRGKELHRTRIPQDASILDHGVIVMEMKTTKTFSSFSVDDLQKAKQFYGETLGLAVEEQGGMGLRLMFENGGRHFIYLKQDHRPAAFTVLNFPVDDIESTVQELRGKGVGFEQYSGLPALQDELGVLRGRDVGMGPDVAWFKDPAGNVLSVLQERE